jgi:DNA primase
MTNFLIQDYLKNRGIPFKEAGNNIGDGWIGVSSCPVCRDERYHLGVNKETANFHCWVCGAHGGIRRLIHLIDEVPYDKTETILQEYSISSTDSFSISFSKKKPQRKEVPVVTEVELPTHILPVYDAFHRYPYVFTYLQGRGFTLKDIETWDAYFCYGGMYSQRLIFPLYMDGKLMTFTGRAVVPASLRYKSLSKELSILPIKNCLFNYDRIEDYTSVCLCEGIFDALKVQKLTGDLGIAICGKVMSGAQKILLMRKRLSTLTVMLDRDASAGGIRLATELSSLLSIPVRYLVPTVKDPATATTKEELGWVNG